FESGDAACDERVLPGDRGRNARELQRLRRTPIVPAGMTTLVRRDVAGADELIEGGSQCLTARRRAEPGVDARQVGVQPSTAHADDVPQRLMDRVQATARQSE